MKNILMSAALAAVVVTGSVATAQAENFKGAYAGIETGAVKDHFKVKALGVAVNVKNKTKIPVNVNFGYQTVTASNIYMAAQAEALMTFNSGFKFNPGMTFKFGYKFGERFVLAGTFGASLNRYELPNNATTVKKTRLALRPGVEGVFALDAKNYITASYQYSMARKMDANVLGTPVKVTPTSHAFLIGYKRGF